MTDQPKPVLVTHSGKFHCDEVFAYAVLRLALGLHEVGTDHVLTRTRKPTAIEAGDIVFDVGGVFDQATDRYDHHQRGAPLRPDGTPFSSAGLVWRRFGEQAVRAMLPEADAAHAASIASDLDEGVVRTIDEIDNGIGMDGPRRRESLGLASLIGDLNPTWDDPASAGEQAGDAAFWQASALAEQVLRRKVEVMRARMAAETEILDAHRAGPDPRLLVLERGMPWKNVVHAHKLPVLLAVSPASNGNWMLDTVPPEPGSFAQKLPLPADWAGLPENELRTLTGVPDAVFAHLRRFVASARSREGAIAMARLALRGNET